MLLSGSQPRGSRLRSGLSRRHGEIACAPGQAEAEVVVAGVGAEVRMNTNEEMKKMDGGAFPEDAWLERLLREDVEQQPHIDDAGFSARLIASLPPPRKPVPRWLV